MRWVRRNLQIGSRLALVALALQILLSFTHVHLGDLSQPHRDVTSVAVADETANTSPQPPITDDDRLCPVCVLIQLAGTTVQSVPPVLHLPALLDWVPPETAVASVPPVPARSSFNPRAPPSA